MGQFVWVATHTKLGGGAQKKSQLLLTKSCRCQYNVSNVKKRRARHCGETLTEEELESLPSAILQHLVSQQLKLIQDSLDPEEEKKILQEKLEQEEKDRLEKIENGDDAIDQEGEANTKTPGFDEEGLPSLYVSPLEQELEVRNLELLKCTLSRRSVMYYYLELLQQRRICNAATNNDGRSSTIVILHEWLMVACPEYLSRCCYSVPPLFQTNAGEEGEGTTSEEPLAPNAIIFQWYEPDTQPNEHPGIDGFV